jgi:hypothetical protein
MSTHHDWSELDFDWKGLDDAINIIYWWTRHIGRFGGQLKEKFGRIRFYVFFSDGTIYSIVKPGYYFYRWPKWIQSLDYFFVRRFVKAIGLLRLIHAWQFMIYRYAYKRAVDKHLELKVEILADADGWELLEGIHGFRHYDHWTLVTAENKEELFK